MRELYTLAITTQGPLYPPSEVMDADGNFIVIGQILRDAGSGKTAMSWGAAVVSPASDLPSFGQQAPYRIIEDIDLPLSPRMTDRELYTLPLPLPCTNYPMLFAPQQRPQALADVRPSYPFHKAPIPDIEAHHGRRLKAPVTLGQWMKATGLLQVTQKNQDRSAEFAFEFTGLIPESLYTVMSLRARDLDPAGPSRPGPLGVPNVFITDGEGKGRYRVDMPNPFPDPALPDANPIISVVVLWMSSQMSYGGAIGHYGLGGDIHAQLKLPGLSFQNFRTRA